MQSNTGRALAAVAGLVLIVVLFFVFSGDDETGDDTVPPGTTTSSQTTTDQTQADEPTDKTEKTTEEPTDDAPPTIVIKDGQPEGGVAELTFDKGDDIRFVVDSDTADEVHFHGYDIGEDVEAGGTVEFDVPATIDGIFEVELESTATQIAEITVNP